MKQFDAVTSIVFSPVALCDEIEQELQPGIIATCERIEEYLRTHEQIAELPGSISDVVHMVFYQLHEEIRKFFRNEQDNFFPLIRAAHNCLCVIEKEEVESNREDHRLILKIVKMLRQLMCDYLLQPHWSDELRECILELFSLENKIYKWIELEQELLFPLLTGDLSKSSLATAC